MNVRDLSLAITPEQDGTPTPYLRTAVVVATTPTWTVTLDGVNVAANPLNNVVATVGDTVNVLTRVGAPPLVLGVTNATSRPSWGMMGRATVSTDQTGISALADITGLSVPFTGVAGRRYLATLQVTALSVTAGGLRRFVIDIGGATVRTAFRTFGGANNFETITFIHEFTATGSTTVKARASSDANTVTIASATSTAPGSLLVQDIGAA